MTKNKTFDITIFNNKKAYDLNTDSIHHKISFVDFISNLEGYHRNNKGLEKETAKLFVAGIYKCLNGVRRNSENLISRSMVTLDIDNFSYTSKQLMDKINCTLSSYNYVYYSTSKHTNEKPRLRLVIPLEEDILRADYKELCSRGITEIFGEEFIEGLDTNASFSSNYMMYLYYDNHTNDQIFNYKTTNGYLNLNDFRKKEVVQNNVEVKTESNIEEIINDESIVENITIVNAPLNITDQRVKNVLELYDVNSTDYHNWLQVGQALHHQYSGDNKGYELFLEWSLKDGRYDQEEIKKITLDKYNSFSSKEIRPITFASVIHIVNGKKKNYLKIDKKIYHLINEELFVHRKANGKAKSTYENFVIMCNYYDIKMAYDEIKKEIVNNLYGDSEGFLTRVNSLLIQNNMDKTNTLSYVRYRAKDNTINSFEVILNEIKWDGIDRITDFCNTVEVLPQYIYLRDTYILCWIKQMLYLAIYNTEDIKKIARYLLIFRSNQGTGKTTWVKNLLPAYISEKYIMEGATLNTDNMKGTRNILSYLIVELGELEHSFKKTDINAFKSFFGKTKDTIEILYTNTPQEFRRTTSFCGTINDYNFLKDNTGSTRFLVLPVIKMNGYHNIDMLQLYKQILETTNWVDFELNEKDMELQKELNSEFEQIDPLEEMFLQEFDITKKEGKLFTCTQVLEALGFGRRDINKHKTGEMSSILRKHGFENKNKHGFRLTKRGKQNDDFI